MQVCAYGDLKLMSGLILNCFSALVTEAGSQSIPELTCKTSLTNQLALEMPRLPPRLEFQVIPHQPTYILIPGTQTLVFLLAWHGL